MEPEKITLYGGPAHGQSVWTDTGYGRIEVAPRPLTPPRINFSPDPIDFSRRPVRDTTTYYVKQYVIQAITEAGATVYKSRYVGVWEHGNLTPREQWELEREMDHIPWKWSRKPNFLTEFDQWFEYRLNETGWQQPRVRYF